MPETMLPTDGPTGACNRMHATKKVYFAVLVVPGDQTITFCSLQAKASVGSYKEAEDALLMIQNEKVKSDYVFQSWLAR